MRDIVVTLIVFTLLPFVIRRPYIGILLWSWLGYMNPHRLSWGFAYDFPFSQVTAIATFVGLLFWREARAWPRNLVTIAWALLLLWMTITSFFGLNEAEVWMGWQKAMKIQLFALLTVMLMQQKERVNALVWTIALSLGFYGLKGGQFVFRSGGESLVWGPPGTFIADNNDLALALIMTMPLLWYLFLQYQNRSLRIVLGITMVSSALAVLGSHSRGAALAGSGMLFSLWLKSRYKMRSGLVLLAILPVLVVSMPQSYFQRMGTIATYDQDSSAMGRIRAWTFATDMAVQRPIGGGFNSFTEENYRRFAPDIAAQLDQINDLFHESHSIYFRMLGEHGFLGLALFLMLGFGTYRLASRSIALTRDIPSLQWARDLSAMLQVSMLGYAIGGAFLGLAYFDLYYHLVAMIVVVNILVQNELAVQAAAPVPNAKWQEPATAYRRTAP